LPNQEKKRTLDDRERLIYAPFSGVGGIVYDKDAVYIELGGSHSYSHHNENNSSHNPYINSIITSKNTIDSKLTAGKLKIFSTGEDIDSSNLIDENADEKTEKNDANKSSKKMLAESEESNEDEYDEDEEFDQDEEENEEDFDDSDEEDDDEEDSDEEEEDGEESNTKKREKFKFDDDDDEEDEEEEDEEEENTAKWKKNLKLKASVNFEQNKKVNWGKLVYEASGSNPFTANTSETNNELFRIKKIDYKSDALTKDNSKHQTFLNEWGLNKEKPEDSDEDEDEEENPFDKIKDCFVTGKWESDKDAQNLLDDDEDEDVFGDFEDFESGKKFSGKKELNKDEDEDDEFGDEDEDFGDDDGDDQEENGAKGISNDKKEEKKKRKLKSEMTKSERLIEKKRRLKEKFNEEFDAEKSGDPNENNYLNHLEHLAEQQTSLNRLEFEKMEDRVRVEYEGFRSGMYVRIEIRKMPCEFVKNFDSRLLAIVGSLGVNESNIGYVQVRLKKHRWYRKILKTKDPLIVSLGWRRFQTIPIYFIQDHNMRNRSLKYTPQHMFCHASFWGGIIF
jgi:ribosome biogenesis protein BMS1